MYKNFTAPFGLKGETKELTEFLLPPFLISSFEILSETRLGYFEPQIGLDLTYIT